jgi:hypothetical protein
VDALEQFCRQTGLSTERGLVSGYEGVAVTLFAVYIIAGLEVVARCLAGYHTTRQPSPKVTYFTQATGNVVVQDFSPEGIAKVLRTT